MAYTVEKFSFGASLFNASVIKEHMLYEMNPGDVARFPHKSAWVGKTSRCDNCETIYGWLKRTGMKGSIAWMPKGRFYSFHLRG